MLAQVLVKCRSIETAVAMLLKHVFTRERVESFHQLAIPGPMAARGIGRARAHGGRFVLADARVRAVRLEAPEGP